MSVSAREMGETPRNQALGSKANNSRYQGFREIPLDVEQLERVAPPVFETSERPIRSLAGSIPARLRQDIQYAAMRERARLLTRSAAAPPEYR